MNFLSYMTSFKCHHCKKELTQVHILKAWINAHMAKLPLLPAFQHGSRNGFVLS